jgi:alpha-tubulin suppressor-like RCC1 family protein
MNLHSPDTIRRSTAILLIVAAIGIAILLFGVLIYFLFVNSPSQGGAQTTMGNNPISPFRTPNLPDTVPPLPGHVATPPMPDVPDLPTEIIETMITRNVVSAGLSHSLAITADGTLWAWGANSAGQLGDGTTIPRHAPVRIMENVASVSAGPTYTLAITNDGVLWAWGANETGQLGDGSRETRLLPTKIMSGVIYVSATTSDIGYFLSNHTMAITHDNVLWGWGRNSSGQLGDGTRTTRNYPVRIKENVVSVSAGCSHTAAITSDGVLWTWGSNSHGQLGDGEVETLRVTPHRIMENVSSVSAGSFNTMATQGASILWGWGHNHRGQLTDAARVGTHPNPVFIWLSATSISVGSRCIMLAICWNGILWEWGWLSRRQIFGFPGDNSFSYWPLQRMENVRYVSDGGGHVLVVRDDGSLWAWGANGTGQLGDNSTTPVNWSNPIRIKDNILLPVSPEDTRPPEASRPPSEHEALPVQAVPPIPPGTQYFILEFGENHEGSPAIALYPDGTFEMLEQLTWAVLRMHGNFHVIGNVYHFSTSHIRWVEGLEVITSLYNWPVPLAFTMIRQDNGNLMFNADWFVTQRNSEFIPHNTIPASMIAWPYTYFIE